MEVTHVREENKKLVKQMTDLKGRLADLEARVRYILYTTSKFRVFNRLACINL